MKLPGSTLIPCRIHTPPISTSNAPTIVISIRIYHSPLEDSTAHRTTERESGTAIWRKGPDFLHTNLCRTRRSALQRADPDFSDDPDGAGSMAERSVRRTIKEM